MVPPEFGVDELVGEVEFGVVERFEYGFDQLGPGGRSVELTPEVIHRPGSARAVAACAA